jgi:hypothetical protein
LNISDATIDQMIGVVRAESQRLDKTYRSGASHLDLAGKVAIGVEDGHRQPNQETSEQLP